ncbi:helix-turn-helix transcriptional regulator [Kineosporia mesophila]|uniref:Helix-turn-helix transcriptional regulator n=2 Tax=Kineosporia mesophila TaxID=566012 RepID=A0ABP6ZB73_9ACTN
MQRVAKSQASMTHGQGVAPHRHENGLLLYPAAGVLTTTTDRGTWVAPANRVTWTPPDFEHHHRAYGDTEVRMLEVPAGLGDRLPGEPAVFAVSALLREALLVLTGERELRAAYREALRQVVVEELIDSPSQDLYLPRPVDDRLRAVTDLLHADPADSSTLAQLGRAVGASERTLSRLFQTELGMSFHQWRSLLRVQHALVRLVEGEAVIDTAARLGWSNPTSFIEAFTAVVGQTPGRYRAELRHASD